MCWGIRSGLFPTQDLVDAYLMKDEATGKWMNWWETSQMQALGITMGADGEITGEGADYRKMFENRDKRFYATVTYDGSYMGKKEEMYIVQTWVDDTATDPQTNLCPSLKYSALHAGMRVMDNLTSVPQARSSAQTLTGYYSRKYSQFRQKIPPSSRNFYSYCHARGVALRREHSHAAGLLADVYVQHRSGDSLYLPCLGVSEARQTARHLRDILCAAIEQCRISAWKDVGINPRLSAAELSGGRSGCRLRIHQTGDGCRRGQFLQVFPADKPAYTGVYHRSFDNSDAYHQESGIDIRYIAGLYRTDGILHRRQMLLSV